MGMFRRNFLILSVFSLFLFLIFLLYHAESVFKPFYYQVTAEITSTKESQFYGKMALIDTNSIYVIENEANRDLEQVHSFLLGRLSALHYLFESHFLYKKNTHDEVTYGLFFEIDSEGFFQKTKIYFKNTSDKVLEEKLIQHIQKYWRYKASLNGKTTVILIPVRWYAK